MSWFGETIRVKWLRSKHPDSCLRNAGLLRVPSNPTIRAPPHESHDEHRQCNPGGGIHVAVLLGSDNSYTTPFEIPFFIRSLLWWRYMVGGPLYLDCQTPCRRVQALFAHREMFCLACQSDRERQKWVEHSGGGQAYDRNPPQRQFWIPPPMI